MIEKIELTNEVEILFWIKHIDRFHSPIIFSNGINLVIGKNRSGKSTLLNLLSGKIPNTGFNIITNGKIKMARSPLSMIPDMAVSHGESNYHMFSDIWRDYEKFDTFLIDEIDEGSDINLHEHLAENLIRLSQLGKQVILTTNSVYFYYLLKDSSHIIEMSPNYKQEFEKLLDKFKK